jgi:rubredoxin
MRKKTPIDLKLTPLDIQQGKKGTGVAPIEGAKRQNIPYTLEWTCPDCKFEHKVDFTRDHLSYPQIGGKPSDYSLYCGEGDCDYEGTVKIAISITAILI